MCRAPVTIQNGLMLKWCYDCGAYTWCRHETGRFFCTSCGNRVRDWVTKLLYKRGEKDGQETKIQGP